MNQVIDLWNFVQGALSLIGVLSILLGIYYIFKGTLPVLIRLGNGLTRRKIAIFAKNSNLRDIESLLGDSSIFTKKNFIQIESDNNFGRADLATFFLICYWDWSEDEIRQIIGKKADKYAMLVYSPKEKGNIPPPMLTELNKQRNFVLSNFRGRLLNDVIVSLITTSYQ